MRWWASTPEHGTACGRQGATQGPRELPLRCQTPNEVPGRIAECRDEAEQITDCGAKVPVIVSERARGAASPRRSRNYAVVTIRSCKLRRYRELPDGQPRGEPRVEPSRRLVPACSDAPCGELRDE
jgi:hypothetical protein